MDTLQTLKQSNLFTLINTKPRIQVVTDYPQYNDDGTPIGKMVIRLLSHEEHIEIQGEAVAETERLFEKEKVTIDKASDYYKNRHDNICAKYFLWRALRDPENPLMPLFPTPETVGRYLTNNQVATIEIIYRQLEDYGPNLTKMTNEDFERWVDRLATAAEGDFGSFLGRILPVAQVQLLMYQAKQLTLLRDRLSMLEKTEATNSQTDNLYVNTLPSESTTELKNEEVIQSPETKS
jgi:hypothetical protein